MSCAVHEQYEQARGGYAFAKVGYTFPSPPCSPLPSSPSFLPLPGNSPLNPAKGL